MKVTLREWQQIHKDITTFIVQASVKNGSDSWQSFPIGMGFNYVLQEYNNISLQVGTHNNTLICSLNLQTDGRRRLSKPNRQHFMSTLIKNGYENTLLGDSYFTALPNYKFVVSPEGNGIDCHRHYESLMAGCIPIIEHNPLIEDKYKGCPILYTSDYSEINEQYLQETYERMLNETFDFSRLFLSFYTEAQINTIKDCGNYWIKRSTGKKWY